MEKVIFILLILFIMLFNFNNVYSGYFPKLSDDDAWMKIPEFKKAYNTYMADVTEEEGYAGKAFNSTREKVEEYVWKEIKGLNEKKLEEKKNAIKNALDKYVPTVSNTTKQLFSTVSTGLLTKIEKKQKGEKVDDKATEFSETAQKELEDRISTEEDTEPNGVGTLKQRDLGLATAKESTTKEYTPDEIIKGADDFLNTASSEDFDNKDYEDNLKNTSNTVYNILLGIAIVLAVVIGLILGITFMLSGAGAKAKVKEALIPYVVGCFISFSAFGIWKILMMILNEV